jgi:tetratricopeptide (TPR) repeat protein
MQHHLSRATLWLGLLTCCFISTSAMEAADLVRVRNNQPGQPPLQRQGEIVDLAGEQLHYRGPSGSVEAIPLEQVVEWKTTWPESKEQADALLADRKFAEAATLYTRARQEETRTWARREIMARSIESQFAAGNIAAAAEEFLAVAASDPETRHWEIAPLGWRSASDPNLPLRAEQWLRDAGNSERQLIAASWLLNSPQRTAAVNALQAIAAGPNKRLASLAVIQLWRTRVAGSAGEEPAQWLAGLERLPTEVRPIGYFVIGEGFARHQQPEQAALAYLKIPILYPGQRALAAEALLAAGSQLEKMGRRDQAASLYREVLTDHASQPAAETARRRLEQLATPAKP